MLYLTPFFLLLFHYWNWMWKRLSKLHENLRAARKIYSPIHEAEFFTLTQDTDDKNSNLGLYKNQPEFKELNERRSRYLEAFYELREFQRTMLFDFKELHMCSEDEETHEVWDMKMQYKLGINKRSFFSYYPEYIKSLFGNKNASQTKNPA